MIPRRKRVVFQMSDFVAQGAVAPIENIETRTVVAGPALSEAGQMLAQLRAIILDPTVPEARLNLLIAMQKDLQADQRRMMFVEGQASMSLELPTIERTGKIVVYSKADRERAAKNGGEMPADAVPMQQTSYAKQEDIIEAVRPILGRYGFTLNFYPSRTPEGRIGMRARLSHVGGHFEEIDMPSVEVDSSGSKNNIQGGGSSQKYLMRYATLMLLNIVSRDQRDGIDNDGADGKTIDGAAVISDQQYADLATVIDGFADPVAMLDAVCKAYNVVGLSDLPADKFTSAMNRLAKSKAARKKVS